MKSKCIFGLFMSLPLWLAGCGGGGTDSVSASTSGGTVGVSFGNAAAIGAKAEIESIVTRVISSSEFEIGDILVRTNASTLSLFGTPDNIVVGARLEVEGFINSSSELDAIKVKFEDNDARIQASVDFEGVSPKSTSGGCRRNIKGPVTAINPLTVLGRGTADLTDVQVENGTFSAAPARIDSAGSIQIED